MIDEATLRDAGWVPHDTEGFIGHVGGLWERERDGAFEFAFVARDFHANRNGVVHGGMIMTFVDRACGQTVRRHTGAPRVATVNLTHNFLRPLRIGVLATIRPRITQAGGTLVFIEGHVVSEDETIASAQGVWRRARGDGSAGS